MMTSLWHRLLGAPETVGGGVSLPTESMAAMLVAACLICAAMLNARIRAREVVRG
jgi:hypothetical protein